MRGKHPVAMAFGLPSQQQKQSRQPLCCPNPCGSDSDGKPSDRESRVETKSSTSRFLPCLIHHLPHRRARTRRLLLAPGLQPPASIFNVRKQLRILECCTPDGHDAVHAVPYHPDLSVALKEKLIVDQSAIHNARHHIPVADDHANESVLFSALRKFLHHVFWRRRMKMFQKPRARLPQPRLASHLVELQHQVYFFIRNLAHFGFSLLSLSFSGLGVSCGEGEALASSKRCTLDSGSPCR